ncbi:hypothetical protein DIE04_16055 [Burkholderia sp. Bp8994]|nr:hypothetical protein DIE20_18975 [Burkholderia sp. Bp9131]RQR73825.1 hypothetical protein DIE12_13195 [Burkholderia sp. Bp9015]RQR95764.1 hypothetical protein DIE04_16055 [Burkholderia sp. Bp8994]RQS41239.1 hypothetical protein DIE01_12615 [Burkholderia sp. Bp8990]RQZ51036.1 hypothetical protein DIE17_04520 [Burkholderia sp. Bp9099]
MRCGVARVPQRAGPGAMSTGTRSRHVDASSVEATDRNRQARCARRRTDTTRGRRLQRSRGSATVGVFGAPRPPVDAFVPFLPPCQRLPGDA